MKKITSVVCGVFLMMTIASAQGKKGDAGATPTVVTTKDAPTASGPYSQAIKAGGFVFAAGQIAIDPATGKLVEGDIKAQTERVLKNLSAVLSAGGTNMQRVVKTTVYLKNMSDFAAMNEVYGGFFKENPPARSTVQAAGLPKDALVEIEVVAQQ
jgi:2-iminobutanoate/2-iminopropanoate deaminase